MNLICEVLLTSDKRVFKCYYSARVIASVFREAISVLISERYQPRRRLLRRK
jgi:hypothetical protein